MTNLVYWIWFASVKIRYSIKRLLLDRFGDPKGVYFASAGDIKSIEGITANEVSLLGGKDLAFAERTVTRCAQEDVRIMTLQDAEYPERLRYISDPPCVLYIKGRLPAVDSSVSVAVVGTRDATPYGKKISNNIGYELASCGAIVVTGLADGCDSEAAKGALLAQGKVIGVLGTAINEIYPKWNKPLFDDVQAVGALVSEYPPDFPGHKSYFRDRNRIIAGLSLATVVTQAPVKSGALITANRALDYGRDVFAVPANADAKGHAGSNNLIREGAKIAETGWDVLIHYESSYPGAVWLDGAKKIPEELEVPKLSSEQPKKKEAKQKKGFFKFRVPVRAKEEHGSEQLKAQLSQLSENQLKIVAVMTKPNMHVDDLIDLSGLPAATVLSEMTLMQMKGVVRQEAGKRFTLNISKRG